MGSSPPACEPRSRESREGQAPRQRRASRAHAWGMCARTPVSMHAPAGCPCPCRPCPFPPGWAAGPRLRTSRKQSCSSENSGSLSPTVRMMASRVCVGAAQWVCVNLLNSGCDGRGRMSGCALERKGGQPQTRTHTQTHADTRGPAQGQAGLKDSQGTQAELRSVFPDRKWTWGRCTLLQSHHLRLLQSQASWSQDGHLPAPRPFLLPPLK